MSKRFIIDTEATAKFPNTANLLQFCALEYDENPANWKIHNWYFSPRNEVPAEVQNITGLNKEILDRKSEGLTFEEQCDSVKDLIESADLLIGHNINKYDKVVIRNNFHKEGLLLRKFPDTFDTMTSAKNLSFVNTGRYIKLGDLYEMCLKKLNIEGYDAVGIIAEHLGLDDDELSAHNAKWDVIMNAFVYRAFQMDKVGR